MLAYFCRKMKLSFGFAVLFFCFSSFGQCRFFATRLFTDPLKHKICSSALLEDSKEFYEKLQQTHPDLYRFVSPKQLDSSFLNLINICSKDLTLMEYVIVLNQFVQQLKDSHTFVSARDLLSYKPLSNYYVPFFIQQTEQKWYITSSWKNVLPKGEQLLAINTVPLSVFHDLAQALSPRESCADSAFTLISDHLMCLVGNLSTPQKALDVKVFNGTDTITREVVRPKRSKTIRQTIFEINGAEVEYMRSKSSAVLTISSFSPKSISRFKKKLEGVFRQITQDSVKNLVLDLRSNTGGFILLQEYLMSFLVPKNTIYTSQYVYKRSPYDRFSQLSKWKKRQFIKTALRFYPEGSISREYDFYKKPMGTMDTINNSLALKNAKDLVFLGNCDLLVNELSMSASANFTAWFLETKRGGVYGAPPSGTTAGTFANPYTFYLTNTGLPVSVSTMKINLLTPTEKETPLMPTSILYPTFQDIKQGTDPVLQEVLKKQNDE